LSLAEKLRAKLAAAPKAPEPPARSGRDLSTALIEKHGLEPHPLSRASKALAEAGVSKTFEFDRILALPRRTIDPKNYTDLTEKFRKPWSTAKLRPFQSIALAEMARCGGLFGALGVGIGKTLLSLLAGDALKAKRIVLLVPPEVRDQLINIDIPAYSKDWNLPLDRLHIVAYSELSLAHKADILERLKPDLIIADEAHKISRPASARVKRLRRYMKDNPATQFVALSGTMTKRSIKDFAQLIEWALRKGSPLPIGYRELTEWSDAYDVVPAGFEAKRAAGALILFCNEGESLRSGFRRRLVETPGVVATVESAVGTSLYLRRVTPDVPPEVKLALAKLRSTWAVGDDEIEDAMRLATVARQLACGFYYEWIWPQGVVDMEWLEARNNWNRCVRQFLARRARAGLDSPLLVFNACARGERAMGPEMLGAWEVWNSVRDRPEPETSPVWLSKYLVNYAEKWATEIITRGETGIVWYEHKAIERALPATGMSVFGGGMDTELLSCDLPVVCASAFAHGTGKNLQRYSNNLILSPPASGARCEQIVGRTHRPGQEADEVHVDFCLQTSENEAAFASALKDAAYIEETQGQKQKLLYGQRIGW